MTKKAEEALYRLVESLNEEQKLDLIRVMSDVYWSRDARTLESVVLDQLRKKAEA